MAQNLKTGFSVVQLPQNQQYWLVNKFWTGSLLDGNEAQWAASSWKSLIQLS